VLITDMIENPRVNLSYGMAAAVCTLFVCMVFIMFVACSLPPGMNDFIGADTFMDVGWSYMGVDQLSSQWLLFPAQIAMAFGFFLPATKLLYSMAQSNLIPEAFGLKASQSKKFFPNHSLASIYVVLLSYFLCLFIFYVPEFQFENVPILLAQFTYLSDLYAFYRMRIDFNSRDYKFRNPFGIVGAGFAACFYILTAIAVIGFLPNNYALLFVGSYFVVLTAIYFGFAKKHQSFSDDEQKSLLVLHVIKNNQRKRNAKGTAAGANKKNQYALFPTLNNRLNSFAFPKLSMSSRLSISGGSRQLENSSFLPLTRSVSFQHPLPPMSKSALLFSSTHAPNRSHNYEVTATVEGGTGTGGGTEAGETGEESCENKQSSHSFHESEHQLVPPHALQGHGNVHHHPKLLHERSYVTKETRKGSTILEEGYCEENIDMLDKEVPGNSSKNGIVPDVPPPVNPDTDPVVPDKYDDIEQSHNYTSIKKVEQT